MKRGWKIFWITCAVALVTGIICCIAALILGVTSEEITDVYYDRMGDNIGIHVDGEDDSEVISDDSCTSYTGIRQISADLYAGDVSVRATAEDHVIVETSGLNSKLGFQCRQEGDTLELSTKKHSLSVHDLGTITIYIPQNLVLEEADFSLGAGTLFIEDICARDLELEIGAGEANVDFFEADVVDASCGAGKLTFAGTVKREVDIECGAGEVDYYASGNQDDYNYEIESGIGEIRVGDRSYSGLAQECYIDNQAAKDIVVDCGIGQVTIYFSL